MLNQDEIDKIIAEEKLRHQIKNELEAQKKKTFGGKLVDFFNSNLGLFILSSGFVSLLTWGYTQYKDSKVEYEQNSSQIEKIKGEVAKRTSVFEAMFADSLTYYDFNTLDVVFTGDIDKYDGNINNTNYFIYEDLKKTSIEVLLNQLKKLDKRSNYSKTIKAYQNAYDIFISLRKERDSKIKTHGEMDLYKFKISTGDESMLKNDYSLDFIN